MKSEPIIMENNSAMNIDRGGYFTLLARDYKGAQIVNAYAIGNGQVDQLQQSEKVGALNCMHDQQAVMISNMGGCSMDNVVRRLTPTECSRLQGFPDGWCDIGDWVDSNSKKHKDADSPKYKALGNSIALPFWEWLARRIAAQYERPVTMGSLFDGIGGFPLAFMRAGGKAVWASEIEEFPIAVTKKHFGDEEKGEVGDVYKYL